MKKFFYFLAIAMLFVSCNMHDNVVSQDEMAQSFVHQSTTKASSLSSGELHNMYLEQLRGKSISSLSDLLVNVHNLLEHEHVYCSESQWQEVCALYTELYIDIFETDAFTACKKLVRTLDLSSAVENGLLSYIDHAANASLTISELTENFLLGIEKSDITTEEYEMVNCFCSIAKYSYEYWSYTNTNITVAKNGIFGASTVDAVGACIARRYVPYLTEVISAGVSELYEVVVDMITRNDNDDYMMVRNTYHCNISSHHHSIFEY